MADVELILGTAGHVDHGKTALIKSLTGEDTDRLPEEQRRGISIELGFAELRLPGVTLGVVDVPGHERYLRQMVAGAAAMDLALVVIAADESISQQTREHVEILDLLGVRQAVIAITKRDRVESQWLDAVTDEVRQWAQSTFLAAAPIRCVSAHTQEGIERLKVALTQLAQQGLDKNLARRQRSFRMSIDRVFPVAGHGTVVTGSVVAGTLAVGDSVELLPSGQELRIRGLQNHGREVERVSAGQRAAINVVGVHHDQVQRGEVLATPGSLKATRRLWAELRWLEGRDPLKHRRVLRVYLGGQEQDATVRTLQRYALEPGGSSEVHLTFEQPVVADLDQPLIVRDLTQKQTLGGGRVLWSPADSWKGTAAEASMLGDLAANEPTRRMSGIVAACGTQGWQVPTRVLRDLPANELELVVELEQQGRIVGAIDDRTKGRWWHLDVVRQVLQRIVKQLDRLHAAQPVASGFASHEWQRGGLSKLAKELLEHAIRIGLTERQLELRDQDQLARPGQGTQLSAPAQRLMQSLIQTLRDAELEPPTLSQLIEQTTRNRDLVPRLLEIAAAQNSLVMIDSQRYLHRDVLAKAIEKTVELIRVNGAVTVAQIKEHLGLTRRTAVPLCETLDRLGITQRQGDARVLGPEV